MPIDTWLSWWPLILLGPAMANFLAALAILAVPVLLVVLMLRRRERPTRWRCRRCSQELPLGMPGFVCQRGPCPMELV